MPPIPGMVHWHSLLSRHAKGIKSALAKGLKALDAQLSGQPKVALEPILIRNTPKQPLHPLARIRQSQSRWYSTARKTLNTSIRDFTTSTPSHPRGVKYDRSTFPRSTVGDQVLRSSGRAPFASTLRPNLTGGTLGRTAGGYTLGSGRVGGARYFSHGPAAQAHVVQNVSQAVRAFFISGQKAQYDGISSLSGNKRFKAVTALQDETNRKVQSLPRATPGSRIEFQINPTITALTPLAAITSHNAQPSASFGNTLNTDGLLDILSADFSRALKDLSVVLGDLRRLSGLGDLPITREGSILCVHFPGCDSDSVQRLCEELNIQRGMVYQDETFDSFNGTDIALLFPYAPSHGTATDDSDDLFDAPHVLKASRRQMIHLGDMMSPSQSAAYSTQSEQDFEDILAEHANPWLSPLSSGYQSVHSGTESYDSTKNDPLEYQGFEGIYRFIEELDAMRR